MPKRMMNFAKFGRSRWFISGFGAVTAVALIVTVALSVMNASASATYSRPPWADKFNEDEGAKTGEIGRLDRSFEEEFTQLAYPAADIPIQATINAQTAFGKVKGNGNGKHSAGSWSLVGPSSANFPGVLTFSGANYTTSGRITALAIAPGCNNGNCTLWVGAAGGGVWRTDKALHSNNLQWKFVSGSFATNAIGALTYDAAHHTLYAGTGEPNASGDSEAGMGIYKSTDGGDHWTHLASQISNVTSNSCAASDPTGATGACVLFSPNGTYSGDAFAGRSISSIVVDPNNPNILYVSSTRGVRGISSVTGGGTSNPPTARPPYGLFKSIDGGATFTFVWDGNQSVRGVNHVELDPSSSSTVYAAAFQQGIWRSTTGGSSGSFSQIHAQVTPSFNTDRTEFAVTKLPNGKTRMYAGEGSQGEFEAIFFRTDDAAGAASFTDLTSGENEDYCTGQCWYDNYVVTPAGHPDTVYLGGSYQYGEYGGVSNSRGVLYSTNAGQSFTDESWDATSASTPNGIHPDQHALVVNPSNPTQFFEGSDGGLMRSSGSFANASSQCASRGLSGSDLTLCQQLLSRIPTQLSSLNEGLSTLQFQSLSVAPDNPKHLQGGTQDNGTFETYGSTTNWPQIIYGDGGQSGFSATNSSLRFNTFTGQATDVNFRNGDPTKWVIATGPIVSSDEFSYFYPPVTADPNPANAGTIYQGSQSVWRTQDWGGDQAFLEANCPEFTTSAANPACGDFTRIGPAGATDLTGPAYGADRLGNCGLGVGCVAAIERAPSDTSTLWAATGTGRVFISKNANNKDASTVTWTRIDTLASNDPNRFVSSIYVDPSNSNHAWISYSGYNFNTPSQPGHVFEVTYNPSSSSATWNPLDGSGPGALQDLPATDLVRDDVTGDLYASSDFGVMVLDSGTTTWKAAGAGLPNVEVAGLTIVPGAHVLYAATHGRSAWKLTLS